jgi:hypothetical protein
VDRQHAEQRVHARDQAHHRQGAVEQRDGAGVDQRVRQAVPGGDAPGADRQVHRAVQHVHREDVQQVAVQHGELRRRGVGRRRAQRGRNQAEQSDGQVNDAEDQGKGCGFHRASAYS